MGIKIGDDLKHAEAIGDGFTEAEDAAATDGHSRVLDVLDGSQAVLVGMRGHDVRIVFRGGVEVVIVGGYAGGFELLCLLGAQLAEGDADFHSELGYILDDIEDLLEALCSSTDAAPCGTHAEAGGAGFGGDFGALEDIAFRHQTLRLDAGFVACGLRAVGAVLGAAAGFDGEKSAELDFRVGPIFLVRLAGLLDEIEKGEGVELLEF